MFGMFLLAWFTPTTIAILIIAGFLLFGRRLPEMGRSLGKAIIEFKKGLSGIEDDVQAAGGPAPSQGAGHFGAAPPAPPAAIEPPRAPVSAAAPAYQPPPVAPPRPAPAMTPASPEFRDGPQVG
ncbi:MAG TPA: twin-arginine translocase TatA/TatE family subunit [Gemmatales bacterium]|nr:twin-arginine translocase TatA/TatE family subunit [Gemmatales bacterium]HMP59226.1 twin-arginine translocase TatA/TatE family subunit [Gemmatales bacterium]